MNFEYIIRNVYFIRYIIFFSIILYYIIYYLGFKLPYSWRLLLVVLKRVRIGIIGFIFFVWLFQGIFEPGVLFSCF